MQQPHGLEPEILKREFAFQLARAMECDPVTLYRGLSFDLDFAGRHDLELKIVCHGIKAESGFPRSALMLSLDEFTAGYLLPLIYEQH